MFDNDFLDNDEGYRSGEFSMREPFYAEALPCESCGKPVDCERRPASYDPSILVGPCCEVDLSEVPEMPACEGLYKALMRCVTVGEVCEAMKAHKRVCATCRKDDPPADLERAA